MKKISLLLIPFGLLILGALLFLSLPASLFSEASDLTHSERDAEVMAESRENNQDFAVTNNGIIAAFNLYKKVFGEKLAEANTSPYEYTENKEPAATLTPDEFSLICAIIEAEGDGSYDDALALISVVYNRVCEGTYDSSWERLTHLESSPETSDPLSVITSKDFFASYVNYSYLKVLNKSSDETIRAVRECLTTGKVSHNYTSFRDYETAESEKIGSKWYFLEKSNKSAHPLFNISSGNDSSLTDTGGTSETLESGWDLLYLICAYDLSKGNIESHPESSVSRFFDLFRGIGEYIFKSIFGVEVEIEREEVIPQKVPRYSEEKVHIIREGKLVEETLYRQDGESEIKAETSLPLYSKVEVETVEGDLTNLTFKELRDNQAVFTDDNGVEISYPLVKKDGYFIRGETTETITPEVVKVVERKRVKGFKKSVLLSVLGINPNESPPGLTGVTNSTLIDSMRDLTIKTLGLTESSLTEGGSSGGTPPALASGSWVWPLDPNGVGSFTITSLMGTRESPGGIGSTDHGGTDIGAAYGTAIIAIADGTVEIASTYYGYGNCVRLNHGTDSSGETIQSLYGHMSVIGVSAGQSVHQGEVIGYVGSTGWSTGPHLHFEVIKNGEKINGLSLYGEDIYSRLTYYL